MVKLAFFVLIVFALNMGVKLFLRKMLNIEKEKKPFFSYNYINDLHKKIDWGIRITSVITIMVTNIMVLIENYSINLLLIPLIIIGLDYPVRAFFERNYSQNPKQAILTLTEGILMLIAIAILFKANFFITP
ncbi:DUF4181 domain-containing protein [Paenisporosarcina sp. NPDC076898]|uniref:DUF4181 domain-containing protein n=1 Tax=unclassified Paenisporosarcina TaxID=2642018 RepID=UPI003CFFAE62